MAARAAAVRPVPWAVLWALAAARLRVITRAPSSRSVTSASSADSSELFSTEVPEMSRTEEVIRSDSAVLMCGPPPTGARVRRAISGSASSEPSAAGKPSAGSTSRSCHGWAGSSSRPRPSRRASGQSPTTVQAVGGSGTRPSRTTGRCSGA